MRSDFRRFAVGLGIPLVVLALIFAVAPTAGARQEWDQAKVTALATELADAVQALEKTLRREPHLAAATERGGRNAKGLWESVNRLKKSARQLRSRTDAGAGYEETLPIADKIRTQVRDANRYGSGVMTTTFMDEKIAPVQDLLNRLEPYYF
ncbi:MAG: hypothetical protein QF890_09590 [Myxococcota bacterium]|jgi:hypothetical protein|nr:hypothetical protein [Deltaproteobacteria bacterium]MCP4241640.1 hypothetical protein [bacterium]MDP6075425.1 hypothetical protein [Myxococcota bacterium]MBT39656.1 hypothetical protein [Deltaproteobacteria bacterium]MDP7075639.1 hypothetical protein [Myxococcota bacterium]|tara:strand:- start:9 stop:464 length:456 start_codon:yes stop_codon:yes gene_type:complete